VGVVLSCPGWGLGWLDPVEVLSVDDDSSVLIHQGCFVRQTEYPEAGWTLSGEYHLGEALTVRVQAPTMGLPYVLVLS
jgi:hypothetical protein